MPENITTLIFIRHGQTDWNVAGRWQGHTDTPLNDVGRSQAQAMAARLATWPKIDAIYSSNLQRAAMTAAALGEQLGIDPVLDSRWRERHLGQFQGLTRKQIRAQFPEVLANKKGGIDKVPDGEHQRPFNERAAQAFEWLLARHENETAVAVTHGGFLHAMLQYVLELPIENYGRISLRGNTGISIVEVENGRRRLVLLNDTAHLEIRD